MNICLRDEQMHCHLWLKNLAMLNEGLDLACDVERCYQLEGQESTVFILQPQPGKGCVIGVEDP